MIFCKHDWVLLSEFISESKLEYALKLLKGTGLTELTGGCANPERKHIQVFTCNKCGKLNRFVEKV